MHGVFVEAAIRAEVKRARRDQRDVDLRYLYEETCLPWDSLESTVSRIKRELNYGLLRGR